jgi:hypothetical protein
MIDVPYWWDGTKATLLATIHKFRSELVPQELLTATPISDQAPVQKAHSTTSGIVQVNKPQLLQNHKVNPKGW